MWGNMSDIRRDHDRQERTNTLAVVSFISSFFVAVAGIVTGHMALRQIRRTGEGGRGLAIAGLVIGYCSTATILIFVTVLFVATTSIVTATDTVVSVPSNTHNIDDPTPTPAPTSAPTPPSATLAEGRTWNATLTLDGQRLGVQLLGQDAPQAVASFISLATKSFFDQSACHRLTTGGFDLLQCGDPTGTGAGGPDYHLGPIENAPASEVYKKGSIVMARKGNDATSMGSQFLSSIRTLRFHMIQREDTRFSERSLTDSRLLRRSQPLAWSVEERTVNRSHPLYFKESKLNEGRPAQLGHDVPR